MNQASHLFQLQSIDIGMEKSITRISEINGILAGDLKRQTAENQVKNNTEVVRSARIKLQKIEDEVQAIRIKIETSESSMYGGKIQNPKELQDLQSETLSLKKRLSTLEDQQLEAMIELERVEDALEQSENALEAVIAQIANEHAALLGERTEMEKRIQRYQAEREGILRSISEENHKIYEQLRNQRKGIAVSRIEDDACQVCGASLRPAEVQAAKSPGKLVYCSSCGRILFAG